jgi:uncharacterized protein YqgC (DUF456 family)
MGIILILIGIVGLFLPFLQGIALIIAGLAILSTENRHAKYLFNRLKLLKDKIIRKRGFYDR